jgi:2'-5' RNA ligase
VNQSNEAAVFILTLGFDEVGFKRLDGMRRAHFPAKRNLIPAHLTLFHKLPGENLESFTQDIEEVAGTTSVFPIQVGGLRFLGYGTAYVLESPKLIRLRADLATRWTSTLSPQDAQRFKPHVTIQNKVGAPVARSLFDRLEAEFEPFTVEARALLLWRYLDGPWSLERRFDLRTDD